MHHYHFFARATSGRDARPMQLPNCAQVLRYFWSRQFDAFLTLSDNFATKLRKGIEKIGKERNFNHNNQRRAALTI
jgi:hypothetical protein